MARPWSTLPNTDDAGTQTFSSSTVAWSVGMGELHSKLDTRTPGVSRATRKAVIPLADPGLPDGRAKMIRCVQ